MKLRKSKPKTTPLTRPVKPYCEDYYTCDRHPNGPCPQCPSYRKPAKPPCTCKHAYTDHYAGKECFYSYNCGCKRYHPKENDVITKRPEEEPGYGHGV